MTRIQKILPLSAMRIGGILYGGLGLVIGLLFGFTFAIVGTFAPDKDMPRWLSFLLGPIFVIIAPLLYGAIGAVMFGLSAVLYNFATRFVGGLELELIAVPAPASVPPPPLGHRGGACHARATFSAPAIRSCLFRTSMVLQPPRAIRRAA